MICAIVPAAGRSRRMGEGVQKLLLPVGGKPMIAYVVDELLRALEMSVGQLHSCLPLSQIIVVTRVGDTTIAEALVTRPVQIAVNPVIDGDMLSSIRAGLAAIGPDCRAVLVAPADHPHVLPEVVQKMIATFAAAPDRIVVPIHQGRRGHPILFPVEMRAEVMSRFDGEGLRGLLKAHADRVVEVAAETASILQDVDLPEDYRRMSER